MLNLSFTSELHDPRRSSCLVLWWKRNSIIFCCRSTMSCWLILDGAVGSSLSSAYLLGSGVSSSWPLSSSESGSTSSLIIPFPQSESSSISTSAWTLGVTDPGLIRLARLAVSQKIEVRIVSALPCSLALRRGSLFVRLGGIEWSIA